MGVAILITSCAGCGEPITANPVFCPSIRVNGERQAICKSCHARWNEIHRTSKGLEPVPLHPKAYSACDEQDLG